MIKLVKIIYKKMTKIVNKIKKKKLSLKKLLKTNKKKQYIIRKIKNLNKLIKIKKIIPKKSLMIKMMI